MSGLEWIALGIIAALIMEFVAFFWVLSK